MIGNRALCLLLAALLPRGVAVGQERIVSLAPGITEILSALDLGSRVAGVTSYCRKPKGGSATCVGGVLDPSLERILSLRPDLVVGSSNLGSRTVYEKLDALGVPLLLVRDMSLKDALAAIRTIGGATDREERADGLVRSIREEIGRVRGATRGLERPRVLVCLSHDPLVLAGAKSYVHELVEIAGGENIAGDSPMPYLHFSFEEVVARRPEVIIEASMGSEAGEAERKRARRFWARWPTLPAVEAGRILFLRKNDLLQPGPRVKEALSFLLSALHPRESLHEDGPHLGLQDGSRSEEAVGGER